MKQLIKSMTVYGLGGVFSRFVQFLLLPIYTRFLLPSDYGQLEMVYMVGGIIAILYGFMISSGFVRNYYDNSDVLYRKELLSSTLWFTFTASCFFLILTFYFAPEIVLVLFNFNNGDVYLKLITISVFITAHNQIFYNLLMVQDKARRYVTINIVTLTLSLILAIIFVVYFKWSITGILLSQVLSLAIEFSLLLFSVPDKKLFLVSFQKIGQMLKYSLPLIPLQISSFVLELSDRLFLQKYQSLSDVGLYSLGYKFAAIIPLFAVLPLKGFTPYLLSLINTPEKCKQTLADFYRYYIAGVLFITLVISLFSKELIMIIADKPYHDSWIVVYVLCISYAFYGSIVVVSHAIDILKKNWISATFWAFAAAINILLNYLLIPPYGMMGAAVATTIAYLVILLCYFWAAHRIYYVPFQYSKFFFIIVITTLVYFISMYLHTNLVIAILGKSLLAIVYLLIVYLSGYFRHDEISRIKNYSIEILRKFALIKKYST